MSAIFPFEFGRDKIFGSDLFPFRPIGGVEPFFYVLDSMPTNLLAFSMTQKLSSTYTGFAFRAIRTSDLAEQDIGFESNGFVDINAFQAFIGASTARCSIWYNQCGGENAVQTTFTQMPIISLDSGWLRLEFNGAGINPSNLQFLTPVSTPLIVTLLHTRQWTSGQVILGSTGAALRGYLTQWDSTRGFGWAASPFFLLVAANPAFQTTNFQTVVMGRSQAVATQYLKQSGSVIPLALNHVGSDAVAINRIGSHSIGGTSFQGTLRDLILFPVFYPSNDPFLVYAESVFTSRYGA